MNEISEINIENMIYEIREKQVMIDSDLAKLYCVETKRINEAVSRNKEKFPERFCFRITEEEYNALKSQIATSKGGSRKGHLVFTEQGVAMLATILKSKIAIQVSIRIMDAFVAMRHYIGSSLLEQRYINDMVLEHDSEIKLLKESFKKFDEKKIVNEIYYKGQIYDAYSRILDIFNEAKEEVIIVDRYASKTILDMIRELKVKVILITKEDNKLSKLDVSKYNEEYQNLTVIYSNDYHDRYFILDRNVAYHCGTSVNNAGSRLFSINMLTDKFARDSLINKVMEEIDGQSNNE